MGPTRRHCRPGNVLRRENRQSVRYSLSTAVLRQTAQCIERAAYRICEELRLDIVTLNAIGNAVVGLIEIELANGQQLVASEDEPRMAADRDSRARTHLANERTFLAWLRTGLSLMAVGLAVAGFLPIDLVPGFPYVRSFSMLLVLSGTVMVVYGANRYERAFKQIETGAYEPARTAVVTIAAIIGFLGILTIPAGAPVAMTSPRTSSRR